MWRFGYVNPVNYNDNEVFCGGIERWDQICLKDNVDKQLSLILSFKLNE
jgi:hypothetical protein